jgi:hypothetical protein
MMKGGHISWKSEVLSTSDVKYMVASLCGQEIVYIRAILRDFGWTQDSTTCSVTTGSAIMKNETPETCFCVSRKTKCTEHISGINLLMKALPVVTL